MISSGVPILSVIIPPANNVDGLRETLASLDKFKSRVEAIVCDAAELRAIPFVPALPNVSAKRIRTSRCRAQAINKAMDHCGGALLGILSPGDTYFTAAIENVLQVCRHSLKKQNYYGNTIIAGQDHKPASLFTTESDWQNRRLGHCRFSPPGVIYYRELVRNVGGLNEALEFWAEYDLWLRLDFSGYLFQHVPGLLASFSAQSGAIPASDFSTFPSDDSVKEMLRVRAQADMGTLSWEHLAWYGATSAFFAAGKQSRNFLYRLASALKHIKTARAKWQPAPRASTRDNALLLAALFHRVWRRTPQQEFGHASQAPKTGIRRFLGRKLFHLEHHAPRPVRIPRRYKRRAPLLRCPTTISIVTPTLNQGEHIESTIRSVLDQSYPALEYVVQDGGSSDATASILQTYSSSLASWESAPDGGQASAINRGFSRTSGEIMAYLNSDDLLLPGSLAYVARFFASHPKIDVVYGHRILIDVKGQEIGRWVLPQHDNEAIAYADFIPQETLFWRRSAWKAVGETIDESFKFAMDYDLILRFRDAGLRFHRLPRFLGAFRVWQNQKTQSAWLSEGVSETRRLMLRTLGKIVHAPEQKAPLKNYLVRHWWLDKLFHLRLLRH